MTVQHLDAALKAVCSDTYETAVPRNLTRYVCWHQYRRASLYGNDRNQLDAPRVQIDIIMDQDQDTLVDDVCAALWMLDLPYTVEAEGYDDEYCAYRTILQLVVI